MIPAITGRTLLASAAKLTATTTTRSGAAAVVGTAASRRLAAAVAVVAPPPHQLQLLQHRNLTIGDQISKKVSVNTCELRPGRSVDCRKENTNRFL